LGIFTLRLRSDYLAIVTLAFAQIMPQLLINLKPFTGGAAGLAALPPPRLFGYVVRAPLIWYYLTLAVVLLVIAGSLRLVSSRRGRAWMAASEDRLAAVSSGVDASRDRIVAWALGAGVAGVAGALFAMVSGYVDPGQSDFLISAMVLAMVVIGGAGSVWGAVVGALLVGSYDLFGVRLIGALVEQLARATGSPVLVLLDLRALSVGSFGIALYITMLIRGRRGLRSAAP
jgi:branched-chain amino acid transport system permease protein